MCESPYSRVDRRRRPVVIRLRAAAAVAAIVLSTAIFPGTMSARQTRGTPNTDTAEELRGQTMLRGIAKVVNFAILGGVLFYFLRTPISTYLVARGGQIRQDLVSAAEMRATAAAQLADIERKLQALPAELDALRAQGALDVKAEQARIAHAAAAERERLIAQTHREIDARLRMAKRQLTEHAAELAVKVAEDRIRRTITPEDQLRLVDRYAAQLREAR